MNQSDGSLDSFNSSELESICQATPIQRIEFRQETDSTNNLAIQLAENDNLQLPLLVLTESQTSGRGRQTNRWWSSPGALTFSVLLDTTSHNISPSHKPQAALAAGLAVCEALEELAPEENFLLKWPNDVYATGKKICGILCEVPKLQQKKLVIGIGINVNNLVTQGPEDISSSATSLREILGQESPLTDVLIGVLNKLMLCLEQIISADQPLFHSWKKRCMLTGKKIQAESINQSIQGICQGIDQDGALLIETGCKTERCLAGTITLLENDIL